jgi:hypothetical protein
VATDDAEEGEDQNEAPPTVNLEAIVLEGYE